MFPTLELYERNCIIVFVTVFNLVALWVPIEAIRVITSADVRAKAAVTGRISEYAYGSGLAIEAHAASALTGIIYLLDAIVCNVLCIGGAMALIGQVTLDVYSAKVLAHVTDSNDAFADVAKYWWAPVAEFFLRLFIAFDAVTVILQFP